MLISVLFAVFYVSSTTALDLGGVVSGNRMSSVPLGHTLGDGELDVEGVCTGQGVACQNCTQAVTCVALPVGWLKIPLNQCSEGETCNAREGGCTTHHVPECQLSSIKHQHICEQVGIFPDAFDCRRFHLCSPPTDFPLGRPAELRSALCPRHYAYNTQNAQCSIRLSHGQCDSTPVPKCETIGQTNVLDGSPNHYYICLPKHGELYPQIFLCPNGWYFWDGFCRPEPNTPKEPPTTETDIDTTTVTEKIVEENPMSFFSTERATTYPLDTFLADKFDLSSYEHVDSGVNSFGGTDFWVESDSNSFETGFGAVD